MSNAAMETYPNVLSVTALTGNGIVYRPEENLGKIVPRLSVEGRRAEGNKSLCRSFIQKILNEGEVSSIGDFMSADVVNHEVADSFGDSQPRQGHGIKWMVDLIYLYRRAFPDLRFEILDQIAEGDRVVTCLRMRGTQENALMAIAASGREIDIAGIRVDRMSGDRIIESWFHLDLLGMLRQLDALPPLNRRPQQTAPVSHETAPGSTLPVAVWNPAPALLPSASVSWFPGILS